MKRLFYILFAFMLVSLSSNVAAQNTKEEKAIIKQARKAELEAVEKAEFEKAKKAIMNKKFIIEADQIQFPGGRTEYVSSMVNFISMDDNKVSIQVVTSQHRPGQNGIGGFTVDGNLSEFEATTTPKGIFILKFNVMGIAISASVSIQMTGGGNKVTAKIFPNFSSNTLTMSGRVITLKESRVYKGRSI